MLAINVFGLAMPTGLALLFAGIITASLTVGLVGKRRPEPGGALWVSLLAGFIAARASFVASQFPIYAEEPFGMLDFRDGGFDTTIGVVAAAVTAIILMSRQPDIRRPLMAGIAAGLLAWGTAAATLQLRDSLVPSLPETALATLEDDAAMLGDGSGRPVVVNLWASWCPPCRREMPVLATAQRDRDDVRFVFVNQGEAVPTIQRYLEQEKLVLRNVLRDPFGHLAREVGSIGLPTTLFYAADGTMVHSHVGELSPATLAHGLESVSLAND